jgi:hypothetical protein
MNQGRGAGALVGLGDTRQSFNPGTGLLRPHRYGRTEAVVCEAGGRTALGDHWAR